jgi:hypothetical protein
MNKKPYPLDEPINVTMTRTDRVSILAALSVTILQARLEHDDSLLQKHIHARDAMLREPQPTVDTARYKALWESVPWALLWGAAVSGKAFAMMLNLPESVNVAEICEDARKWIAANAPKPQEPHNG